MQELKEKFKSEIPEEEKEKLQEEIRDLENEIAELSIADFVSIPLSVIKRNLSIQNEIFHIIAMSVCQYGYKNMAFEEKENIIQAENNENKYQEIPITTDSFEYLKKYIMQNELNYHPKDENETENLN